MAKRSILASPLFVNLSFNLGKLPAPVFHFGANRRNLLPRNTAIDLPILDLNNSSMPRPEALRRIKSFSAATGYVYQYYFYEVEKTCRGDAAGIEYVYMVSVNREQAVPIKIFIEKSAMDKWSARTGQKLTGTDEYAVAKMRLFQGFDELQNITASPPDLTVDETNLDDLLRQLDI